MAFVVDSDNNVGEDNIFLFRRRVEVFEVNLVSRFFHNFDNYFVVEEANSISFEISNSGGKDASSFEVELSGGHFDDGESLIWSKQIDGLDSHEELKFDVPWTPVKLGEHKFVVEIFSDEDNDIDESSFYFQVIESGANLEISFEETPYFYFDKLAETSLKIINEGNLEAENAEVSMYYSLGMCYDFEECDFTLLETKTLGDFETSDRDYYPFSLVDFSFTPEVVDEYITLAFVVDSDNNVNDKNFRFLKGYVRKFGVDLDIDFSYSNYEEKRLVDESSNFYIDIFNEGGKDASSFEVKLFGGPGDEESLIWSKQIDGLGSHEELKFDVPWTPTEAGYHQFIVNVFSDEDVKKTNNEDYFSFFVPTNKIDVLLENMGIYSSFSDESSKSIYLSFRNLGIDVEDVTLNVYDNNELIFSTKMNLFSGEGNSKNIGWIPSKKGEHIIKAELIVEGDVDLTNNYLEEIEYIYEKTDVEFSVLDSKGNNADRFLYLQDVYETNEGKIVVELPDLSGTDHKFTFGVLNFFTEEFEGDGIFTLFDSSFSKEINVVSEFYDKINQNGKDYYFVYSNELSTDYSISLFMVVTKINSLLALWEDFSEEDVALFYCTDFDFSNKLCKNSWEEVKEDVEWEINDEYIGAEIENLNKHIEAFSISKSEIICVKDKADINDDGKVNDDDLAILDKYWNHLCSSPKWCKCADINQNGEVSLMDLTLLGNQYAEESTNVEIIPLSFTNEKPFVEKENSNTFDFLITGMGIFGDCSPEWGNCEWGPCTNHKEKLICMDLNNCGTDMTIIKDTKSCFIESNCIDDDGDGFGLGPDCLDFDVNDYDAELTTVEKQSVKVKPPVSKTSVLIIAGILILLIAIVSFIISKVRKK